MRAFEDLIRRGGETALRERGRFFMGEDKVHQTLHRIASKFDELAIPYAIAGGMALNAHGFRRATVHVDILVTSLKRDFAEQLNEYVRGKYTQLWDAVDTSFDPDR